METLEDEKFEKSANCITVNLNETELRSFFKIIASEDENQYKSLTLLLQELTTLSLHEGDIGKFSSVLIRNLQKQEKIIEELKDVIKVLMTNMQNSFDKWAKNNDSAILKCEKLGIFLKEQLNIDLSENEMAVFKKVVENNNVSTSELKESLILLSYNQSDIGKLASAIMCLIPNRDMKIHVLEKDIESFSKAKEQYEEVIEKLKEKNKKLKEDNEMHSILFKKHFLD